MFLPSHVWSFSDYCNSKGAVTTLLQRLLLFQRPSSGENNDTLRLLYSFSNDCRRVFISFESNYRETN